MSVPPLPSLGNTAGSFTPQASKPLVPSLATSTQDLQKRIAAEIQLRDQIMGDEFTYSLSGRRVISLHPPGRVAFSDPEKELAGS